MDTPSTVFPCQTHPGPVKQTEVNQRLKRCQFLCPSTSLDVRAEAAEEAGGQQSPQAGQCRQSVGDHRHYLPVIGGSFRAPRAISNSSAAASASVGGGVGNGKLITYGNRRRSPRYITDTAPTGKQPERGQKLWKGVKSSPLVTCAKEKHLGCLPGAKGKDT